MTTINDYPHPRVLFENIPVEVIEELQKQVPHGVSVERGQRVHEPEFDLLVTYEPRAHERSKHLHVLSFGASEVDPVVLKSDHSTMIRPFSRSHTTRASLVTVDSRQEKHIRDLAARTIVPGIPLGEKETWCWDTSPGGMYVLPRVVDTDSLNGQCTPIVTVGNEGFVAAFSRQRENNTAGAWCWSLPSNTDEPGAWLEAFLRFLHGVDKPHFPSDANWLESSDWSTHQARLAADAVESHRDKWREQLERFEREDNILQEELRSRRFEAAAGVQRLLTSDGDDLSDAVTEALTTFGFHVQNMDGHHESITGAKLEDLRVSDPEKPGWIALAEVKGYARGAKANDVSQILTRPVISFFKEAGREPDAVWHIVNANREADPSTRPQPLPADVDIERLGQSNGLLIDTREVFKAVRKVEAGEITGDDVRASLLSPPIRWRCP